MGEPALEQALFVRVVGTYERSSDLLSRLSRYLRLKDIGDQSPFASPQRAVEHEALGALRARDVGIRTPRLLTVADVDGASLLLAYDAVPGVALDVPGRPVSDAALHSFWAQVRLLRAHRIAHRDLRRGKVMVDDADAAWLVGFVNSDVTASSEQLDADLAQALMSVALAAGAERSVNGAVDALGERAVAAALPMLQVNAFANATRAALKGRRQLVKDVASEVSRQCHVGDVQYVELERVNPKTLFTIVALAAATYFLIPQFVDLPGILTQITEAQWSWVVPALAFAAVSYAGAALALSGAVPQPLRALPTTMAQLAASFAGVIAPAGVGGMALNARYLQKSGASAPVAVSAVGLNLVAGFLVHVLMLLLFLVWAGRSVFGSVKLPNPTALLYGVAVTLVVAVVALSFPSVRAVLRHKLWPAVRRSVSGIGLVLSQPVKLFALLGGSALVTGSLIAALYFCMQAFDGSLSIGQVGAVFLVGATIASAAPTPGGLGVMEAALVSGLVAAGLDNSIAVPSVVLYRVLTFWLPILPGYLAMNWLKRADYL